MADNNQGEIDIQQQQVYIPDPTTNNKIADHQQHNAPVPAPPGVVSQIQSTNEGPRLIVTSSQTPDPALVGNGADLNQFGDLHPATVSVPVPFQRDATDLYLGLSMPGPAPVAHPEDVAPFVDAEDEEAVNNPTAAEPESTHIKTGNDNYGSIVPDGLSHPPAPHQAVDAPTPAPNEVAQQQLVGSNNYKAEAATTKKELNSIWEPADMDVLSGRGASINAHQGNKKFRALCFARKSEFEAANHAAKRRIATEIVTTTVSTWGSRFLKKQAGAVTTDQKTPWFQMNHDQAILKACQVMRDHKRPDRIAQRELLSSNGKKRNRSTSTPMDDVPIPATPIEPITENPFGVHDHDVLSGRGAFVNGHVGNARLRQLSLERKSQFDAGNYTKKRSLAKDVVTQIRKLDPPGRFLRKIDPSKPRSNDCKPIIGSRGLEGKWEELSDERAIHKACQVMRDIARPDRKERDERRKIKKLKKERGLQLDSVVAETNSKAAENIIGGGVAVQQQDAPAPAVVDSMRGAPAVADVGVVLEQAPGAISQEPALVPAGGTEAGSIAMLAEATVATKLAPGAAANAVEMEDAMAAATDAMDKAFHHV